MAAPATPQTPPDQRVARPVVVAIPVQWLVRFRCCGCGRLHTVDASVVGRPVAAPCPAGRGSTRLVATMRPWGNSRPRVRQQSPADELRDLEVLRLRESGWTFQAIADKLGCSTSTAHRAASRATLNP